MPQKADKTRLLIVALIIVGTLLICYLVVFVAIPSRLVNTMTGPLLPSQGDHDVFAFDNRPVWSPDGKKIAYVSHDTLFVMEWTGVGPEPLTGDSIRSFSPAWSPDGKQLVFVSYGDGGRSKLYATSLNITTSKILLDCSSEPGWCFNPVWSKDGSHVAFQTYHVQEDGSGGGNWGAAIAEVVDSQAVQVTHLITSGLVSQPVWSSDGQRVALTVSSREDKDQVLVFSKDGDKSGQLQTDTIGDPPSWSPDGKRLAYAADGKVCIWTVSSVELRCITFPNARAPAWSPDDISIALENYADNTIYLMNIDTEQLVFLTQGCFPAWSPDGETLAFQNSAGIATIAADGSGYALLQTTSGRHCR